MIVELALELKEIHIIMLVQIQEIYGVVNGSEVKGQIVDQYGHQTLIHTDNVKPMVHKVDREGVVLIHAHKGVLQLYKLVSHLN